MYIYIYMKKIYENIFFEISRNLKIDSGSTKSRLQMGLSFQQQCCGFGFAVPRLKTAEKSRNNSEVVLGGSSHLLRIY